MLRSSWSPLFFPQHLGSFSSLKISVSKSLKSLLKGRGGRKEKKEEKKKRKGKERKVCFLKKSSER